MSLLPNGLTKRRLINHQITKRIISLHHQGFVVDFELGRHHRIICNEEPYQIVEDFSIKVIDICFDHFSRSYKYLHAIETTCGKKGLLLGDEPLTLSLLGSRNSDYAFLLQ